MSRCTAARRIAFASAVAVALLPGCTSIYYQAMEGVGIEKRHILADRVEDGQDDQREAEEQFRTTLEAFKAVTQFDGGDLEATYEDLNGELERCESRAQDVRDRIASIEQVAADLFEEWEAEIAEISRADLQRRSRNRLRETRTRYQRFIAAMRRAESRMDPVLVAFRDQVLFLKHNLNASAIASLEADVASIESDVDRLVRDMQASVAEAESFLKTVEG